MQFESCKPRPLASSAGCDLWMCADCGTINLSIGTVSMKLKQEHFKDISETMQNALQNLLMINADQSAVFQQSRKINH